MQTTRFITNKTSL